MPASDRRARGVVVIGEELDGDEEVPEGPQRGRKAAAGEDQCPPGHPEENDP